MGASNKKIGRDGHTVVKLPLEPDRQERNVIGDGGNFIPKTVFISFKDLKLKVFLTDH